MAIDYSVFKNYEELLKFAKKLDNDEQRIALICDYFINNVSYNYAFLEAIRVNKESTGIENMVSQIDFKYDSYSVEERNKALKELELVMTEDMHKRYKDKGIIERELAKVIDALRKNYGRKIEAQSEREIKLFGKTNIIKAQPERVVGLVEALKELSLGHDGNILNNAVVENGLMKQGVCAEYAQYIKSYCDDLEIQCAVVEGVGNVDHVWNLVNINGKIRHIDLTNAIYIRDGYGSNHTNAISQNWYLASTEEIFKMQPIRRIDKIGTEVPAEHITANNYNDYTEFINNSFGDRLQSISNVPNIEDTSTTNNQVREVSIDDLIKQVDLDSRATIHGRPTCHIFGDVVLLKYDNYRLVESDIIQTMSKMEKAKKSGLSFASILDYHINSTNEKGKSTGYVMQERATGSAVFDYTDDSSLQNYRSAIVSSSQIPQIHFDKLVQDFVELTKQGLSVDTGNSGNFFYDKEKGFTFIDLQGYKGENYLENEDSRQALSQNICSIFFDRYYSSKTPENEFEQVTDNAQKLLTRLKTALQKVGVTEQEFRYGVIETNDPFIKTVFARQRQVIKSGIVNDNPPKFKEVLKSEEPER